MTKKLTIFSLVLVLVLSFTITAYAQDPVLDCELDGTTSV